MNHRYNAQSVPATAVDYWVTEVIMLTELNR